MRAAAAIGMLIRVRPQANCWNRDRVVTVLAMSQKSTRDLRKRSVRASTLPPGKSEKGMVTMATKIDAIPERVRWEIATKGLTGAYIAISNALKQAVGQKKFDEFNGPLWYEAGKGAKEFASSFGLATENAGEIENVTHLMAQAAMGPEFIAEFIWS